MVLIFTSEHFDSFQGLQVCPLRYALSATPEARRDTGNAFCGSCRQVKDKMAIHRFRVARAESTTLQNIWRLSRRVPSASQGALVGT
jgi:hypothetical protein